MNLAFNKTKNSIVNVWFQLDSKSRSRHQQIQITQHQTLKQDENEHMARAQEPRYDFLSLDFTTIQNFQSRARLM